MSVTIMGQVFASDVQPTHARFTLLALADNANDGGYCRPGVAYLSGKTGLSRSTVFRALAVLEADGLLQRRERRRANGSRKSNAYRISIEALQARARTIGAEEESELAALFDDDDPLPPVSASSQPDTMPPTGLDGAEKPQVSASCQPDTLVDAWCQPDTGDRVTVTPLESSVEPSLEEPPQPPAQRGEPDPLGAGTDLPVQAAVCSHGKRSCRECRTSPRAQAWDARDAAEAAERAKLAAIRACSMCDAAGKRWHMSMACDHSATPEQARAEQDAADAAADAARAARPLPPVPTTDESRAAAVAGERFRPSRLRDAGDLVTASS